MQTGAVPLDELRTVVLARLATMSLRGVARDIGMSPSGLQKFLDGSVPYTPTREKLERWYVRETAAQRTEMSPAAVLAALGVLVRDLPTAQQDRAREELLSLVRALYDAAGPPRPPWLDGITE